MSASLSYEPVYAEDGKATPLALAILYTHMEARTPQQNISHKDMPTWGAHVDFVNGQPYREWFLIYHEMESHCFGCIGQIYLSKAFEIGIAFLPEHQRKGYGEQAVQWLIEKTKLPHYLANINPENTPSIEFFTKLGFTLLQQTYILRPEFYGAARFDEGTFE